MKRKGIKNLVVTNQKDAFDQIAPGWYHLRHWSIFPKELKALAKRWQKGRLLNLGCAHGPDFLPFREGFELYGVDFSSEMIKMARRYTDKLHLAVRLKVADVRELPYPDESFDWAIAVATYHHLRDEEERLRALRDLKRVLRPGGEAFITVWNHWQPRFWFKPKEVTVPWQQKEKTIHRYYYLFSYGEMEKLVRKAGLSVLKSFPESSYRYPIKFFSRNICLLVKKRV